MLNARPDLSSYSRASYFLELTGDIAGARRALREAILSGAPAGGEHRLGLPVAGQPRVRPGRYAAAAVSTGWPSGPSPASCTRWRPRPGWTPPAATTRRAIRLYGEAARRLPLPAYVIALGDIQAAAGRTAAARGSYGLVRAEEALYTANGVNVDVELALFEADHGGDTRATRWRWRGRRRRCSEAWWSTTLWPGRCSGRPPAGRAERRRPRIAAGHA